MDYTSPSQLVQTQIQSTYARVLQTAMGLPTTAHHQTVLADCGVVDVQSLCFRATIAFIQYIQRKPNDHSMRTLLTSHINHWAQATGVIAAARMKGAITAIYTNEIEYDMEAKRGHKPTIETIVPPTPRHGDKSLQHRIMAYSFNQWLLQNKGMRTRDIRIGGGDEEAAKCGMAHVYHVANKRTAVLCARIRCDRNDTADSLHRRDAKQTKSPLCKRCDGHSTINEKQSMKAYGR